MMRTFTSILISLLLFFLINLHAQDFSRDYIPLVSSGTLPEDFTNSATSKAKNEIDALKKQGKKSKDKVRFIISATFFQDNVFKSGKVLYGDPISLYVNKVIDEILKNDPETRAKIRVYIVKTPVVNAYAFDNGVILVNTGLISKLKNEAQLAFVLCHEIVHFKKKHSITAHIEFVGKDKKKRSFNKNGTNLLLAKSKFNRKQESEADLDGFDIYSQTGYSYGAIDGLFDLLQYYYLPFDSTEFDKRYFDDLYLSIPENYYLKKVKAVHSDDNKSDSLSTHPNVRTRKEAVADKMGEADNNGRKEFLVSESEFNTVRELTRFEICRLYMQELSYPDAIYASYALLKKYPGNLYLKKIIARSLYETALYRSMYTRYEYVAHEKNNMISYYKKSMKSWPELLIDLADSVQGNSQQVFYLLKSLTPLETSLLALQHNWKLYQSEGFTNECTRDVCDSLMLMLCYRYKVKLENLSKEKREIVVDTSSTPKDNKKVSASAAGKLTNDNFMRFAFVDILKDPKFSEMYKEAAKAAKKIKAPPKKPVTKKQKKKAAAKPKKQAVAKKDAGKKDNGKEDEKETEEEGSFDPSVIDSVKVDGSEINRLNRESEKKYLKLKEYKKLGIDKIVIVDPFFLKLDERKKDAVQYFSGEDRLKFFTGLLEQNAKLLKLDYEMLSPSSFEPTDIDKYNDFSVVNDWVAERMMHGDFDKPMVLNQEFKTYLQQKHGTKYFLWSGVVSLQMKKRAGRLILFSILCPYILPFTIPALLFPQYSTYYYSALFDIESGKMVLFSDHEVAMKDNRGPLSSMIYDTFYQIKTKPPEDKKKKK